MSSQGTRLHNYIKHAQLRKPITKPTRPNTCTFTDDDISQAKQELASVLNKLNTAEKLVNLTAGRLLTVEDEIKTLYNAGLAAGIEQCGNTATTEHTPFMGIFVNGGDNDANNSPTIIEPVFGVEQIINMDLSNALEMVFATSFVTSFTSPGNSGGYWIYLYNPFNLDLNVILVGGGGGGAGTNDDTQSSGGGGQGGGVQFTTLKSIPTGSYQITVGTGGHGGKGTDDKNTGSGTSGNYGEYGTNSYFKDVAGNILASAMGGGDGHYNGAYKHVDGAGGAGGEGYADYDNSKNGGAGGSGTNYSFTFDQIGHMSILSGGGGGGGAYISSSGKSESGGAGGSVSYTNSNGDNVGQIIGGKGGSDNNDDYSSNSGGGNGTSAVNPGSSNNNYITLEYNNATNGINTGNGLIGGGGGGGGAFYDGSWGNNYFSGGNGGDGLCVLSFSSNESISNYTRNGNSFTPAIVNTYQKIDYPSDTTTIEISTPYNGYNPLQSYLNVYSPKTDIINELLTDDNLVSMEYPLSTDAGILTFTTHGVYEFNITNQVVSSSNVLTITFTMLIVSGNPVSAQCVNMKLPNGKYIIVVGIPGQDTYILDYHLNILASSNGGTIDSVKFMFDDTQKVYNSNGSGDLIGDSGDGIFTLTWGLISNTTTHVQAILINDDNATTPINKGTANDYTTSTSIYYDANLFFISVFGANFLNSYVINSDSENGELVNVTYNNSIAYITQTEGILLFTDTDEYTLKLLYVNNLGTSVTMNSITIGGGGGGGGGYYSFATSMPGDPEDPVDDSLAVLFGTVWTRLGGYGGGGGYVTNYQITNNGIYSVNVGNGGNLGRYGSALQLSIMYEDYAAGPFPIEYLENPTSGGDGQESYISHALYKVSQGNGGQGGPIPISANPSIKAGKTSTYPGMDVSATMMTMGTGPNASTGNGYGGSGSTSSYTLDLSVNVLNPYSMFNGDVSSTKGGNSNNIITLNYPTQQVTITGGGGGGGGGCFAYSNGQLLPGENGGNKAGGQGTSPTEQQIPNNPNPNPDGLFSIGINTGIFAGGGGGGGSYSGTTEYKGGNGSQGIVIVYWGIN